MKQHPAKFIGFGILISLLSFGAGVLCLTSNAQTGFASVLWLPVGISFSTLFLLGLEFWPFLLIAQLALFHWANYLPLAVLFTALGEVGINYFSARFLRERLTPKIRFSRLKDLFVFLLIACFFVPLITSTTEVAIHAIFGTLPSEKIFNTWRAWWAGQAMGTLIITEFFITWKNDRTHWKPLLAKRKWEALVLFLTILTTCLFIFTPLSAYNHSLVIKPYFLFTLMLWAALRFDLLGAAVTSLLAALIAVSGGLYGFVAFATSVAVPEDRMLILQFMLAAITVTGMVVAATVREKSEALDARNEFLDIASHELKTPITSLKLQLQLLQRRLDKQTELSDADAEQVVFLKKVDRQVNRLVKIVEQLLDVSRAERKILQLEREEVKLNEMIQLLVDRLSGDLMNAKCSVKLDLQNEIIGHWDSFRIEQVLENLISNAIKYAPGKEIEIIAFEKNNAVELVVKDHGPGIPLAKQHAIFDRFVRATETRHVQGLGLGLFITRKIVEAHGGAIKVKSAVGEGSSFTVHLPTQNTILVH